MKYLIWLSMFGCVSDLDKCITECRLKGKCLDYIVEIDDTVTCKCER